MAHAYSFRENESAKEKAAEAKGESGELRSIRIEVAENGYTVRCDHAPTPSKSKNGNSMPSYSEPLEYVFESPEKVLAYVKSKLKG